MHSTGLITYLDDFLHIKDIRDDSCNGLQIEGKTAVEKVALAVDFCIETAQAAEKVRADLLIVHHGLIWGGLKSIRGAVYQRVSYMIGAGIGLYAAHLPLDMHPEVGNNAELARLLDMKTCGSFGHHDGQAVGLWGELNTPATPGDITSTIDKRLGAHCSTLPFGAPEIRTMGIISGGAARYTQEAIDRKLDAFLTGESSHTIFHMAREAGITIIYGGHYCTETPGIRALGRHIEEKLGIETVFIDVPTGF
jgi:dinuclear metal center YbgI/SA1388 family protein